MCVDLRARSFCDGRSNLLPSASAGSRGKGDFTATVKTTAPEARCPLCDGRSVQVHSRYRRVLADLPWMWCAVRLELQTRRFFCQNPECGRKIFTERVPSVVAPYTRRTIRLNAKGQYTAKSVVSTSVKSSRKLKSTKA